MYIALLIGKIREDVMMKFQKNNFTLILFNLGGRRFHPENLIRLVQIYLEYKEVTYLY